MFHDSINCVTPCVTPWHNIIEMPRLALDHAAQHDHAVHIGVLGENCARGKVRTSRGRVSLRYSVRRTRRFFNVRTAPSSNAPVICSFHSDTTMPILISAAEGSSVPISDKFL